MVEIFEPNGQKVEGILVIKAEVSGTDAGEDVFFRLDSRSPDFAGSGLHRHQGASSVGGIRNQAFRTPNRDIISVNQPQFERLSCETPGAFKSVFISQNLSFDQYPSSSTV
jgi:hypothetical protein